MDAWYEEDVSHSKRERRMIFFIIITILVVFSAIVTLGLAVGILTSFDEIIYEDPPQPPFYQSITKTAVINHLKQFEAIAQNYSNSRSVNNGYNASLEYVKSQLQAYTNFNVYQQYFNVSEMVYTGSSFQQNTPVVKNYVEGTDYNIVEYSPSGTVTDAEIFVANATGCLTSSFENFPVGAVALVYASIVCDLDIAVENAEGSGAVGVLVQNDISESAPYSGRLASSNTFTIPVLGINYLLGVDLSSAVNPMVSFMVEGELQISWTSNLLADTTTGNENSILVVGSHLDSVPAGPGINDNGSGSAVNLELAIQTFKQGITIASKIRFAWWGAEELGLLGSEYYVQSLTPEEKSKIQVNLNYDMLASPNFFRGIYNGSEAQEPLVVSCEKITQIYQEFFANQNLNSSLTEFNGRSDYGSFLDANITAGGLKTGSNDIKSMEYRAKYGGLANAVYDPCYHQACDTLENVNQEVLMENAQAAANILQILAAQDDLSSYLFQ